MNRLISISIIPFLFSILPLNGQDLYMEDFSVPICENGNGEDSLNFFEAYNYSRNFDLPLEFVIEDNGKSVYTDTKKVWGSKKINHPKDIFYYQYKLQYPHHGTGKWVSF